MKKNTADLRTATDAELEKRIEEHQLSLSNLKFQKVFNQLENPMRLRQIRREIARMKTILRERKIANAKASSQTTKTQEKPA